MSDNNTNECLCLCSQHCCKQAVLKRKKNKTKEKCVLNDTRKSIGIQCWHCTAGYYYYLMDIFDRRYLYTDSKIQQRICIYYCCVFKMKGVYIVFT